MCHCHVRCADGTTVLTLPSLVTIAGPPLPRGIRREVEARLATIVAKWEELNCPQEHKEQE